MASISVAIRYASNMAELQNNIKQGINQVEALNSSVEKMAERLGGSKMIQSANNLVGALDKVGVATLTAAQASTSLAQLDKAMEKLAASGKPIPAAMQATADSLKKVVDQAAAAGGGLEAVAKRMSSAGTAASSVGSAMMPVSLAVAGVGIASVKMATDLNESLANVSALLGDLSGKELDSAVGEMKTKVQGLAVELGKSTTDISGGLYEVISSLGYTNDTFGQLEISAKAGAAGLATTQESFNFLSAVTKTYGDTSEAAFKKAADLGFQAVNFGQTTFPELAKSIGGVAPIAKVAGVSMEEMFAVIATATGVTGNTNEVVTQMSAAMTSLLSPAKDMKEAYRALGVTSGEALIQQHGFVGALQQVAKQAASTGTPLIELLGRKEAFILTSSLAGTQADKFSVNLNEMGKAATANGAVVGNAFEKQTQGVNAAGFAWKQFKSELEVFAQRIGDALIPRIMKAADAMRPLWEAAKSAASWFGQLPEPVQNMAVAFAGFIVVASPVLMWLGKIATAIGSLMSFFAAGSTAAGVLSGAFALLTGPIGLVVAAVAGLIAVWALWGDDIVRVVTDAYQAVKTWLWDKLEPVLTPIIGLLADIGAMFSAFGSLVGAVASKAMQYIGEMVSSVTGWLSGKLAPVFQVIGVVVRGLAAAFEWAWTAVSIYARQLYEDVKSFLLDKFIAVIDGVRGAVTKVTGYFKELYESIAGKSPEVVTAVVEQGEAMASAAGNAAELAAKVGDVAKEVPKIPPPVREASEAVKKFGADTAELSAKIVNLRTAGVSAQDIVTRLGDDAIKAAQQAQELGISIAKLPASVRLLKADAEALAVMLEQAKPFQKFAEDAKSLEAKIVALRTAGVPMAEVLNQLGKEAIKTSEDAAALGLRIGSVPPLVRELTADAKALASMLEQAKPFQKVADDAQALETQIVNLTRAGVPVSEIIKRLGSDAVKAGQQAQELGLGVGSVPPHIRLLAKDTAAMADMLERAKPFEKFAADAADLENKIKTLRAMGVSTADIIRHLGEEALKASLQARELGLGVGSLPPKLRELAEEAEKAARKLRLAEKIDEIGSVVANVGGMIANEIGGRWGEAMGHATSAFGSGAKSISSFMKGDIAGGIQAAVTALLSFKSALGAVFGNETKGQREEFAKGMNMTIDELYAKLNSMGARGQALSNAALNVIGKHDQAANAAWMKEVTAFFEQTEADIQRTADVLAKYGNVWEQLPAALQAARIADEVKNLAEEHAILTANGYTSAEATIAQADAYNELLAKALKTGAEIPPAMLPVLLQMAELGQLTEANMRAMLGLKDESAVDFKAMEEAAKKYGIELSDLGPKFQQAKLNDLFKGLLSDFNLLREGGANMAVVIEKMGPQVNDAVQQAIKFGTEIPASMRPMIEAMAAAGQLVDANGDKLTDLGGLKWATPIEESMAELVRLFKELITQMMGAKDAANKIPSKVVVDVEFRASGIPTAGEAQTHAQSAHSGALVTAAGIRRFHSGTARVLPFPGLAGDEVPAILQTGEAVLRRQAVDALGTEAVSALNAMGGTSAGPSGGGSGKVVDLAEVTQQLKSLRTEQARRDASMPTQIARAVRDEFQKVVNQ